MSANKHYGRQIVLSLFLTVIGILGLLYLASRFLLPHIDVNQQQVYDVLVKLFPLLLGLIMIEIGVLVARRRDEEIEEEADRLPPNAYDRPFHTLPGDDPVHLHTEDLTYAQPMAKASYVAQQAPEPVAQPVAPPVVQPVVEPVQERVIEPVAEVVPEPVVQAAIDPVVDEVATPAEIEPVAPMTIEPAMEEPVAVAPVTPSVAAPIAAVQAPVEEEELLELINTGDFATILAVELENALQMEYDLTLVIINVDEGPAHLIANKLVMLSADLAYSFTRDDDSIAMVLPFYNNDEAKTFTLSMVESCQKEFAPAMLKVGFASRAGRIVDADQLIHEAEAASRRAN
jgi:hypothetical protein